MQKTDHTKCSNTELKMLGDFWTLAIIQTLSAGCMRFAQLEREIEGANPATLTSRLKKLEQQGVIKREEASLDKISVVYSLTQKGKGILPILKEIRAFANKFL